MSRREKSIPDNVGNSLIVVVRVVEFEGDISRLVGLRGTKPANGDDFVTSRGRYG
jgi:hypothetical protein